MSKFNIIHFVTFIFHINYCFAILIQFKVIRCECFIHCWIFWEQEKLQENRKTFACTHWPNKADPKTSKSPHRRHPWETRTGNPIIPAVQMHRGRMNWLETHRHAPDRPADHLCRPWQGTWTRRPEFHELSVHAQHYQFVNFVVTQQNIFISHNLWVGWGVGRVVAQYPWNTQ